MEHICETCKHCCYTPVRITGINTGDPEEIWCEEEMQSFLEEDNEGCHYYERKEEVYED